MTTAEPVVAEAPEQTDTLCEACRHPDAAHDRIATRYCNATSANTLTRACICATARV